MIKKTNRKKAEANKAFTREECVAAFGYYNEAVAECEKINAELDLAINKLREDKAERLAELSKTVEAQFKVMQAYAATNKEAFGDKKSLDFAFGKIGFRTATPSLKTMKEFTAAKVLELVKKHKVLKAYLKVTTSLQKDKLLADRALPNFTKYFAKVGLTVEQAENFFVEPKKEEVQEVAA